MGFWSKLRHTFHSDQHDNEIDEELHYHLAMKQQDGVDPRAARIAFGNPAKLKEETRSAGTLVWLESLLRDVRQGLRQMQRAPLLTLVVVGSLALGIGANSAIFSLVDVALLKPLPVRQPESLRLVRWTSHGWPEPICEGLSGEMTGRPTAVLQASAIAARVYRELQKNQTGYASVIGFSQLGKAAIALNRKPAGQFELQYVSANFFTGLGALPSIGRSFSDADDRAGKAPLAIISSRFWHSHFNASETVLGKTIRINNVPVQIIGVAPPGFFGLKIGEWVDVYAPLSAQLALSPRSNNAARGESDGDWWVEMMARLNPAISDATARQHLSALFQRLVVPSGAHMNPASIPTLITSPGQRGFEPLGQDQAHALWILLLLVAITLLIVCANVANLLLSRSVARQREAAVSLALGAGRWRLLRQYMVESLTLAAIAGLLGLFLSHVLAAALHAWVRSEMNIGGFDLKVDARMLIFTCLISLLTAILFGVAPAWQMARASLNQVLKAHSRNLAEGRLKLPRALVVTQIGLSLTVLFAAGLLTRSLANLNAVNLGFQRDNLIYVSVNPWSAGYRSQQVVDYIQHFRERLAAIPGVGSTATVLERPLSGGSGRMTLNIPGRPYTTDWSDSALVNDVSDGFFETLGIPLLAGRTFQPRDVVAKSDAVIIDDLFRARYYHDKNPLGQQFGYGPKPPELYRIIGVVRHSVYDSVRDPAKPTFYIPSLAAGYPGHDVNLVIHARLDSAVLSTQIQKVAQSIDPNVPIVKLESQTALIDHLLLTDRLLSMVSSAFGVLALLLSAIGLAGLLAYSVARRRSEIGIRMALGATRADVVQLVFSESVWLVAAGLLAGVPGVLLVGRLVRHSLFNADPADPLTVSLAVAVLSIVATLAVALPACRAAQTDPMLAMREE